MKVRKTTKKHKGPKTRKEIRKEQRKVKKMRKNEYYTNRSKAGKYVLNPTRNDDEKKEKHPKKEVTKTHDDTTERIRKEKAQQAKLQNEMRKQRKRQLIEANKEEDHNIRRLEKQLKLHKKKTSIPKLFASDGLDYLLEVCDPEMIKGAVTAERQLVEANDGFDEDFALMTNMTGEREQPKQDASDDGDDGNDDSDGGDANILEEYSDDDDDEKEEISELDGEEMEEDEEFFCDNSNETDDENKDTNSTPNSGDENEVWEDIYGRLRSKDGSVINKSTEDKYVPPAARMVQDKKIDRLKKQLKGLLNRLAESNMHSICTQIEELYMNNSRNDMNDTLTQLIFDAVVTPVRTPERLLLEHVLLITILHANIGTEVGAHFLQAVVKKFDEFFQAEGTIEDKSIDNAVCVIAQLYNFKLFNSQLLYQMLRRLSEKFTEKTIECILLILKSVGFGLRKDDPLALKELILELQKQAATTTDENKNNSRVKFMLDVLLAIKNNNVTKIPNYDTTYSEHLKKILKGFIRKGNYVTQLNISLEDLLKADERGKWWVVGSAWTGTSNTQTETTPKHPNTYSDRLLKLAKKQHMNTDTRRNIFCIIMSAEDYLDAFEKLVRLDLKNQPEREIIHIILHCCLQEKKFNPYYAFLSQKFCDYDRKYQIIIKYSVWDKLKTLTECSGDQISNLAKLLTHLFIEKGLPISTLKVMQFAELDKVTLRFVRQILLGILLHDNTETVEGVFKKVAQSDKLKMFRESLRLFLHHFLLRNLKEGVVPEEQKVLLEDRAKAVEKILIAKDSVIKL